MSDYTLI